MIQTMQTTLFKLCKKSFIKVSWPHRALSYEGKTTEHQTMQDGLYLRIQFVLFTNIMYHITASVLRISLSRQLSYLRRYPFLNQLFIRKVRPVLYNYLTSEVFISVKNHFMTLMGVDASYKPNFNRIHLMEHVPKSQEQLPKRSMNDSFTTAVIPLSADTNLQNKYVTFLGHVRLGRLLEDMDVFAAWVVQKHISLPELSPGSPVPINLVTVLVDKIDFTDFNAKTDADIRLSGHVSWVGKSSVEVVVWLEQQSRGSWQKITRALFLMAGRDPMHSGPAVINAIEPATPEEIAIYAGGESRKQRRIEIKEESVLKVVPIDDEQQIMHDLFLATINTEDFSILSRTLPPGAKWMEKTILSNIVFSHPEDRNMHNKVFGGFLMRQALELSWAAAYFNSNRRPKLEHISDISFRKPVEVSSLLRMHAHVAYTEGPHVQIVVFTEVFDPHTGTSTTTNDFHFTYLLPDRAFQVVPNTYQEAMLYLDGRRKFQHVKGLNKPPI